MKMQGFSAKLRRKDIQGSISSLKSEVSRLAALAAESLKSARSYRLRTLRFHQVFNRGAHVRGALDDLDTRRRERRHLFGRGALAACDDRAGVAHTAPGGRRLTGDKADDRLLEVALDPRGRVFLGGAADLADHDHGVGLGIVAKKLQRIDVRRADEWIPADADTGALPQAEACELVNRLVGQGAALGHNADAAFHADVPGDDAGLRLAGRNQPGAIGSDEASLGPVL